MSDDAAPTQSTSPDAPQETCPTDFVVGSRLCRCRGACEALLRDRPLGPVKTSPLRRVAQYAQEGRGHHIARTTER